MQVGEGEIEPSEMSEVEVRFEIKHLEGTRTGSLADYSAVKFDIKVDMREEERRGEQLMINFHLSVTTKPSVAKFEVGGIATIIGPERAITPLLEPDPETQVPPILHTVYQRTFTALFLLSSIMESPYPPPDLLYTSKGERSLPVAEELEQEEAPKVEEQAVAQDSQQVEAVEKESPRG